jgi:DeoR/GlpR family transcriptional regulator of sugar metabolism
VKQDRITQIKRYLLLNNRVDNNDLCRQFGVSVATIRRDLDKLESEGIIRRIYGGAEIVGGMEPIGDALDIPEWKIRESSNTIGKINIARCIDRLVPDHCTIYLDNGTTLYELAKLFASRKKLTIITNSLRTGALLADNKDLEIYCVGGRIMSGTLATSGIMASEGFSFFSHIDIAVFSADGFIPTRGILELSMEAAILKKNIVKHVDKVIAAIDHTKFGTPANATTCTVQQLTTLVTDKAVPPETAAYLQNANVRLIVANEQLYSPQMP